MANETVTGVTPKAFIKSWLKPFTQDVLDPTGTIALAKKRSQLIDYMIRPWISKANGNSEIDGSIDLSNWEAKWDATDSTELLKYAPFKLTAIANRLDLRGNASWRGSITQPGETRFVFSLINLYDMDGSSKSTTLNGSIINHKGKVPTNHKHGSNTNFVDWRGMNVILEYINVQRDICSLHSYAQNWLDLSAIGTNADDYNDTYKAALEDLTETVINASSSLDRPNASAIGRIRTNEKIFFPTKAELQDGGEASWSAANWQFKQFEINPISHLLEEVFLSNTPITDYSINFNLDAGATALTISDPGNLTDWAFSPLQKYLIQREQHRMPIDHNYSSELLLAKSGDMHLEYAGYLDMFYNSNTNTFNMSNEKNQNNVVAKKVRHKLSLNTCQGCHGGETKTVFTQIAPLGYGESAKYWTANPDTRNGEIDVRFPSAGTSQNVHVPRNIGTTLESDNTESPNYTVPSGVRKFVNVSAFITGRNYDGQSFDDDNLSNADNQSDHQIKGLFWVNDPTNAQNRNTSTVFNPFGENTQKNSFNELGRRQKDLCKFLKSNCQKNPYFDLTTMLIDLTHQPLSEAQ